MQIKKTRLSLVIWILCPLLTLFSATLVPEAKPIPGPQDELNAYVLIVGRDAPMYSWWGHIGIIIENKITGQEYLYDYGNFSFEAESFFVNFARGRLWFLASRADVQNFLDYTIERDRDIHMYKMNLSPEKKRSLQQYLQWNVKGENQKYLYHHYRDNCSTRIRDILNDLTDGQLLEYTNKPSGMTLRQLSRKFSRDSFFGDALIDCLLSSVNDSEVTVWDEMFLPDYLERIVSDFSYTDTQGNTMPLFTERTIVHESKTYAPIPDGPYSPIWYREYLIGFLLALPSLLFFILGRKKLFDVYRMLFLFLAGILGSVLFFMMCFSDHDVTFYNWNILIFSPLCFAIIPLTVMLWKKNETLLKSGKKLSEVIMNVYCISLSALTFLAFLGARIPAWKQDNIMPFFMFIVPYLSFCLPAMKLKTLKKSSQEENQQTGQE